MSIKNLPAETEAALKREADVARSDIEAFLRKIESGALKVEGDVRAALVRAADAVRVHL